MTPLVFLHGFLGSPAEWQPVIERLPWAGPKQAVSLPLADHWQRGVRSVAESLPAECVLIGYSLGARVALAIALADSARVQGLCLVSGHPGLEPAERAARRIHDQGVAERIRKQPWSDFLDDWYRQDVFSSIDDATRAGWIQQKQALDRDYQANLLRCYSIAGQPNYGPQLVKLTTRTMIVVGQHDKKYVAVAQSMQRHAPQLEVHIVPSSGHAVHRERPLAFVDILHAFLASLPLEKTADE